MSGYVIYPTHTLARPRVIAHLRTSLAQWEGAHVAGGRIRATPNDLARIRCVASSYAGHLQHANSHRLRAAIRRRFPWLRTAVAPRRFHHRLASRRITLRIRHG